MLWAVGVCVPCAANEATPSPLNRLGILPENAAAIVQVTDLVAEVCQERAFSTDFPVELPAGYRLTQLHEKTATPWIGELVRQHPEFGSYGWGTFCVCEATFAVNGKPVNNERLTKFAMWWVYIEPTPAAFSDPRYRGEPRRMQLAWIYDEQGINREIAKAIMPNAEFGRISLKRNGEAWSLKVEASGSVIVGNVKMTGSRYPIKYATPAYEPVLLADSAKTDFLVVTYAGHHEQPASGEWSASGAAPWARSFQNDPLTIRKSMIQDGWVVRIGRYERP